MSLSGFISYKRVGWTGQTPWNPTNLNIMDKGIKDNNDMIANLRDEVSALNNNKTNCFTYSVEADNVDDFIKKAVMKIGTISDGTFTVRGAWVGHDYFFMSGLSYKDDLVLTFIYTPTNNVCGVIQALLKQDKINYRQFKI